MKLFRGFFLVGALAVSACGGSSLDDSGFDIQAVGPYGSGYRELSTSYPMPDGSGTRTIKVSVWYPTDVASYDDPNLECAHYLVLTGPNCGAMQDAPPAPPAYRRGYPVVVHSHGHLGWSSQSKWLGEHLSRHGYVVVAPNHEGNTILNANDPDFLAMKWERPLDVSAALDLIESGLPSTDPLYGKAVTDRVVMTGHSRGTVTVWSVLGAQLSRAAIEASCAAGDYDTRGGCPASVVAQFDVNYRDERVIAGMPLAGDGGPGDYVGGTAAFETVVPPVFEMVGSADGAINGVRQVALDVTTKPLPWLEFTGACHNFFAHDPVITGSTTDPCTIGLDHVEGQAAYRTYLLAFVRRQLFDDTSTLVTGILDGSTPVSSIVTFHP